MIIKDEKTVYNIPKNFIDESRSLKGMVRTRYLIEGIIMCAPAALLVFCLTAGKPITVRIPAIIFSAGPLCALGCVGIDGDTCSTFIKNAVLWIKNRKIMLYNGKARVLDKTPLDSMQEESSKSALLWTLVEKFNESRIKKSAAETLIEGENFEFADDDDLYGLYAKEIEHPQNEESTENIILVDESELSEWVVVDSEESVDIGVPTELKDGKSMPISLDLLTDNLLDDPEDLPLSLHDLTADHLY